MFVHGSGELGLVVGVSSLVVSLKISGETLTQKLIFCGERIPTVKGDGDVVG